MIRRFALGAALSITVLVLSGCRSASGGSGVLDDQAPDQAGKGDGASADSSNGNGGNGGAPARSVQDYADECKAALGIATVALPDMNCLNGTEVPITIDGQPPDDYTFAKLKSDQIGCDKAQWLEATCHPFDLVQRIDVDPKVEAVLNCRQKYFTSKRTKAERLAYYQELQTGGGSAADLLAAFKDLYEYNDMGFLMRNKATGQSCFFTWFDQGRGPTRFYGGWLPAPDKRAIPGRDAILAALPSPKPPTGYDETMWNRPPQGADPTASNMFLNPADTASGGCLRCHNHGLFKHSPFIDQAMINGEKVVPSNDKSLPYLAVGPSFRRRFRRSIRSPPPRSTGRTTAARAATTSTTSTQIPLRRGSSIGRSGAIRRNRRKRQRHGRRRRGCR